MQWSLSSLIASVKPTLCTSLRQAHPTFILPTPIAHICHGLYLSGELLISWARSRDSLNVFGKYSPVSCLMCLINVAVDPPGRLWYYVNQNDGKCVIRRDSPTLGLPQHTSCWESVRGVKGPLINWGCLCMLKYWFGAMSANITAQQEGVSTSV